MNGMRAPGAMQRSGGQGPEGDGTWVSLPRDRGVTAPEEGGGRKGGGAMGPRTTDPGGGEGAGGSAGG